MAKAKGENVLLGASEFASTLNGDDPRAILKVLKDFSSTVRRERRMAILSNFAHGVESLGNAAPKRGILEGDENSVNSNSSSDSEDMDQKPATKKFKKSEEWKEDTEDYHVPFVGTAVAKGDIAEVIPGQWPTGLLRSYLVKSPMAVELAQDDWIPSPNSQIHRSLLRRKQGNLSKAIYKAYLKAIAELVTASIPIQTLRDKFYATTSEISSSTDDHNNDDEDSCFQKFLTNLLKKRLKDVFQVLNDETDKGKSKPGIYGGCGPLAPTALVFLQNVSMTSITNARLVCRYLDEQLSDGVLRALLRPPPPRKVLQSEKEGMESKTPSKPSRKEAIRLATFLAQTKDSAVATYICTAGSRERKIKPGILFYAFREGLAKHALWESVDSADDEYLDNVADLLEYSRQILRSPNDAKIIGQKLLLDLFGGRDPLQYLCEIARHAPVLSDDNTSDDVLSDRDSESDELDALSNTGIEARRLLFLLLSDNKRSPLLQNLASKNQTQFLVRVILQLFHGPQSGVQTNQFLLHCMKSSPVLLPQLFRVMPIPDAKQVYPFLLTMHFVSNLMNEGPSPFSCFTKGELQENEQTSVDKILASLFPQRLNRQVLSRVMQGTNPLLVFECLKLVKTALERFQCLRDTLRKRTDFSEAFVRRLTSSFTLILPDLQIILALRTKYDAFSQSKENVLISQGLFLLLEKYACVLPEQIRSSSFDWMKLVAEPQVFFGAVPLVQRRILASLSLILETCKGQTNKFGPTSVVILEIMLRTKDSSVYQKSRRIALTLIGPILESRYATQESLEYLGFELSWWIDALTLDSVQAFGALLSSVAEKPLQVLRNVGTNLSRSCASTEIHFSFLLMSALSLQGAEDSFSEMVIQVATRFLLLQRNPIPFCRFIEALGERVADTGILRSTGGTELRDYALSLVNYSTVSVDKKVSQLKALLLRALAPQHHFHTIFADYASNSITNFNSALEHTRFVLHFHLMCNGLNGQQSSCWKALRHCIPNLLLLSTDQFGKILVAYVVRDIYITWSARSSFDESVVDLLLLSCPFSGHWEAAFPHLDKFLTCGLVDTSVAILSDAKSRHSLLSLQLLGRPPSINEALTVQLRLLSDIQTEKLPLESLEIGLNVAKYAQSGGKGCKTDVLEAVFSVWWTRRGRHSQRTFQEAWEAIIMHFVRLLTSALRSDDLQAAFITTLLLSKPGDDVIDRCLAFDGFTQNPENIKTTIGFLQAIIESDPVRYIPSFLSKATMDDFQNSSLWKDGYLDEVIVRILTNETIQSEYESCLASLSKAIVQRVSHLFDHIIEMKLGVVYTKKVPLLPLVLQFSKFTTTSFSIRSLVTKVSAIMLIGLENKAFLKTEAFTGVSHLAMYMIEEEDTCGALIGPLFCALSESYMLMLKAKKGEGEKGAMHCLKLLKKLLLVLKRGEKIDFEVPTKSTELLLQRLCRSALKHGLQEQESSRKLAAESMHFVKILLEHTNSDSTLSQCFHALDSSEVFAMLTSHSKFLPVISRDRKEGQIEDDRIELIQLMRSCVEMNPHKIVLDSNVWKVLYTSFTAGLDKLDTAIRKLLHSCSSFLSETIYVPFLDEIRWQGYSDTPSSEGRRWDWFVDALDSNRIRDSIAHFPKYDTFDCVSRTKGFTMQDPYYDDIRDVDNVEQDNAGTLPHDESMIKSEDVLSNTRPDRNPRDSRYSPAFVLQLALGALESCLVLDETRHGEGSGEMDSYLNGGARHVDTLQMEDTFVPMGKRLIEKGILALSLASLASRSKEVRGVAVAILGLLLKAATDKEAHALSSWRDRPQIAMLLNSIQRAYLLEGLKESPESDGPIPALPSLVSTFLARASLSIAKPEDSLYVSLNRFFLKFEVGHGAFQDMNRLPGFISLFCATNEDALQARKERLWALHLIGDGFQDEFSYRLVSACHAPELLLTSFENLRLSPFSSEMKSVEACLLLDAIIAFLKHGGQAASLHLIGRIGLLSWIRSICTSGQTLAVLFPTLRARVTVCSLIVVAANAVLRNERLVSLALVEEIFGLADPILELALLSEQSDIESGVSTILQPALQAMVSILGVAKQIKPLEDTLASHVEIHSTGSSINKVVKFLSQIDKKNRNEAALSLCQFPICLDDDSSQLDAGILCMFLVDKWFGNVDNEMAVQNSSDMEVVQKRILLLANHYAGDFGSQELNNRIVHRWLALRGRIILTEKNRRLWTECLELMSQNCNEDSVEATLIAEFLR